MPQSDLHYASDHTPEQLDRSRRTLLHVSHVLGDFSDEFVLVGGLVPVLLVDQDTNTGETEVHIGSADVDLALKFTVVDEERYQHLADRLRGHGFRPATNQGGNPQIQKWEYLRDVRAVKIDFLIDEIDSSEADWGRIMHLTEDLGAVRTLGACLAFKDAEWRKISGPTLDGDHVTRRIQVCGPGAFILLKAIAFRRRAREKDAYDLGYVLRHYGESVDEIARRFRTFLPNDAAELALQILTDDFSSEVLPGPRSASRFLFREIDDIYIADFVGDVARFLRVVAES